ncbi:MAG: ROK family protein [Actinomycetota bacterium]
MLAALDVGGTAIKGGLVDLTSGEVATGPPRHFDAEGDEATIVAALTTACSAVLDDDRADDDRLAVAFPHPFDYETGRPLMRGQRKFDAVYGTDLPQALRAGLGRPALEIRFCHDAEAAAWGEATWGSGRDLDRFLMVTLGTGFGGAVVDRRLRSGPGTTLGPAAELFRRTAPSGGTADDRLSAFGLASRLGVAASELPAAVERAHGGDPTLSAGLAAFGEELGAFLAEVAEEFEVASVVVGGGVSRGFASFGPAAEARFGGVIRPAELGSAAALIGAAAAFLDADRAAGQ